MPERTKGPAGGELDKPTYVYHEGVWRRYRWTPDLLDITQLGDVITGLENSASEDCAKSHLYSDPGSPADVVAVNPPTRTIWNEIALVCAADRITDS